MQKTNAAWSPSSVLMWSSTAPLAVVVHSAAADCEYHWLGSGGPFDLSGPRHRLRPLRDGLGGVASLPGESLHKAALAVTWSASNRCPYCALTASQRSGRHRRSAELPYRISRRRPDATSSWLFILATLIRAAPRSPFDTSARIIYPRHPVRSTVEIIPVRPDVRRSLFDGSSRGSPAKSWPCPSWARSCFTCNCQRSVEQACQNHLSSDARSFARQLKRINY